jgi:hypothetical protein
MVSCFCRLRFQTAWPSVLAAAFAGQLTWPPPLVIVMGLLTARGDPPPALLAVNAKLSAPAAVGVIVPEVNVLFDTVPVPDAMVNSVDVAPVQLNVTLNAWFTVPVDGTLVNEQLGGLVNGPLEIICVAPAVVSESLNIDSSELDAPAFVTVNWVELAGTICVVALVPFRSMSAFVTTILMLDAPGHVAEIIADVCPLASVVGALVIVQALAETDDAQVAVTVPAESVDIDRYEAHVYWRIPASLTTRSSSAAAVQDITSRNRTGIRIRFFMVQTLPN